MGYRKFVDRAGHAWEVRVRSQREWEFEPASHSPERPRTVAAPSYEADPFELSIEELQRLLDSAPPLRSRSKPSPFGD